MAVQSACYPLIQDFSKCKQSAHKALKHAKPKTSSQGVLLFSPSESCKAFGMNILVIEDEINVALAVRSCIEAEGYTCSTAYDGETGLRLFREWQPDVVILDLGLPAMSGLDVCTLIRHAKVAKDPYIIMLTARKTEVDRIIGFSTGADDYIPKPFSPEELVVRLRAVTRRSLRHQEPELKVIQTSHLLLDPERREVLVHKLTGELELVTLSTVEFNILYKMASRPKRVWTRTELLDSCLGSDHEGDDRSIDAYIKRVRNKISEPNKRDRFIKTHINLGYSFEDS